MSEEQKKQEYSNEEIEQVVRRLRVCQIPGLRLMGMVPKGKEDDETTKLENVMGVSIRMTQMGAMPVITSMDFCALALPTYRVKSLSGEYWVKDLQEDDARTYARVYLDSIADLIRQKEAPDTPEQLVQQADPRAMAMLNQLASGGQMPPGMGGPGGGIIPGR